MWFKGSIEVHGRVHRWFKGKDVALPSKTWPKNKAWFLLLHYPVKSWELGPVYMSGLGVSGHGPKIQCFGPTIGLNKIINYYTIFMNWA